MNARSLMEGSASRGMADRSNGISNNKKDWQLHQRLLSKCLLI